MANLESIREMNSAYDYDKCVDFMCYLLGKAVEYSRGEGMSDYVSPDDNWSFNQEVSECQNFVRGAMFEFYCELLSAGENTVNRIRDYSRDGLSWWQPEIPVAMMEMEAMR